MSSCERGEPTPENSGVLALEAEMQARKDGRSVEPHPDHLALFVDAHQGPDPYAAELYDVLAQQGFPARYLSLVSKAAAVQATYQTIQTEEGQ